MKNFSLSMQLQRIGFNLGQIYFKELYIIQIIS